MRTEVKRLATRRAGRSQARVSWCVDMMAQARGAIDMACSIHELSSAYIIIPRTAGYAHWVSELGKADGAGHETTVVGRFNNPWRVTTRRKTDRT